jgi:hypothetical protein
LVSLFLGISIGEIMALRPPKGMKNGYQATSLSPWERRHTFVISTEAQRSGEISVLMLFWKCFSTELSWASGLASGPPKVIEKRPQSGNHSSWKHHPPLCHPVP